MGIKSELNNNCEDTKMIPRNVDGEMCLDVECGSNKAVLYVSKLFAGSKKECVLYENEWLTPNEFQNVSGRRSAKYWKRSIRHNGISLKTLMESGLLKAEDDSLSQADGEHFTIDNSGTGTLKNIQKKPGKKLKKNGTIDQTNTDREASAVQVEMGRESDSDTSITVNHTSTEEVNSEEIDKIPDCTVDHAANTDVQTKDDAKYSNFDQSTQSSSCEINRPNEIHGNNGGCQSDPIVETKEIFAQDISQRICDKEEPLEIKNGETRREFIQPYEVTVTPPPTPPSEVVKGQFIGHQERAPAQTETEFQHKLTVAFKPYLLDHSNAHSLSNTVSSPHRVIEPREPYNSNLNYSTLDLKGGSPVPCITIEHVVTSPGKFNTFHADQRIPPLTSDADRNRNIRDPSRENIHRPHHPSREDRQYRYDTSPYSSITSTDHHSALYSYPKEHDTTIWSRDYHSVQAFGNSSCKCNSMYSPNKTFSAHCKDTCETEIGKHRAMKRQYSDMCDDEPLDLSMKKKRTSDVDSSRDRDIPRDSMQVTKQNVQKVWKPEHKSFLLEKAKDPESVMKNVNGAFHPFMDALRNVHFAHSVNQLSPCYCSLCINPVSLYVPYVLDWKHSLEYKI